MRRACSFLPAATQMIQELGLEQHLVGVTFECRADRPRIVRSRLEGRNLNSAEIDAVVRETEAAGDTLYYLDQALLEQAAPDVIFTQHVCNVCQIGTAYVERAVHTLPKPPRLVPLVPKGLADVRDNLTTIARELGRPEAAERLLARADAQLAHVSKALEGAPTRNVCFLEWLDPLYHCGHWIPEQIELAGGHDPHGTPTGHSGRGEWQGVRDQDPDVLLVAPCGFDVQRALRECAGLTRRPGYAQLRAARQQRAFVVDADLFTQPSLGTLVQGVQLLAHLLHPERVAAPAGAAQAFAPIPTGALPARH